VDKGKIHSTDSLIEEAGDYKLFFQKMKEENNFGSLSRMHSLNLKLAKESMLAGITPVVIDNTNLKANESKSYVVYALNIGFDDDNIKVHDIGTNGLTAEQLAERNTHGVPLDMIRDMIMRHKSVGTLTLKKILESKYMYESNNILYSAVVLTDESKVKLLKEMENYIPKGWNVFAHHMTIGFGKPAKEEDLGKKVILSVDGIGISDMAVAVRVNGYESLNKIAHITIAVNPDGGKPMMSNNITHWVNIYRSSELEGIVTNFEKNKV
jgi:hypothetical protein